jgi:hypothetical protein
MPQGFYDEDKKGSKADALSSLVLKVSAQGRQEGELQLESSVVCC